MDVLQTQLFILRALGNCMAYHWKCYRDSVHGNLIPQSRAPGTNLTRSTSRKVNVEELKESDREFKPVHSPQRSRSAPTRPNALAIHTSANPTNSNSPLSPVNSTRKAPTFTPQQQTPQITPIFIDPPPLEEPLASFIINVMTRFFHTSSSLINPDFINHSYASFTAGQFEYQAAVPSIGGGISGAVTTSSISNFFFPSSVSGLGISSSSGSVRFDADFHVSHSETFSMNFSSVADTLPELHKAAGRVMFFLSASNWNVVYARIKTKLIYLTQGALPSVQVDARNRATSMTSTTAAQADNNQIGSPEAGDLTELRFLEWSNLNRYRLGM
ncbi:hypothetical protein HK096_000817, partial [Nowakowskiella sp. JEL0078]